MKNFRAGVLAARRFVNTGPTFTQWKSNTAAYSTASFLQGLKRPSAKDHLSALTDEGPASLERLSEPGTGGRQDLKVWQPGGGRDRNIHSAAATKKSIDYMHFNPVVAGL